MAEGNYIKDSDVTVWPNGYSDTEKQAKIDRWETEVERRCRDVFYEKEIIVKVNGTGKSTIFLSHLPRLLDILELKVNDILLSESDYEFDEFSIHRKGELEDPTGTTKITFPKGYNNIEIKGTFGWTSLPLAVKEAIIILISSEFAPENYEFSDFEREKVGDASQSKPLFKRIFGIVEADKLLSPYIFKTIAMKVI